MNRQGQVLQLGVERNKSRRRIQECLDAHEMNFAKLADYAGVTSAAVYMTVAGLRHSPRVLQALRDFGVPEQYLFDPRKHTPYRTRARGEVAGSHYCGSDSVTA